MSDKREVRPIDANALLDAMPKTDVLLRHQVVDVICNSPSIDVAPVITGETSDGYHRHRRGRAAQDGDQQGTAVEAREGGIMIHRKMPEPTKG